MGVSKRGQQHQPEAQAVDADVIVDGRVVDPGRRWLKTVAGGIGEPVGRDQAERDARRSPAKSTSATTRELPVLSLRNAQQRRGSRPAAEQDDVEEVHRKPPDSAHDAISDDDGADHHPGGIAADVAGLQQPQDAADGRATRCRLR